LYLSTHCFLFFPGTSLAILAQRSFADKEEGCFLRAASRAFCWSSDHKSSLFSLSVSFEASNFFSSSAFLVSFALSSVVDFLVLYRI